jgi:SAM-dependent methyltransferase
MSSDTQSRRIASEIRVFAGQEQLHASNPAADWRNIADLAAPLQQQFGVQLVHEIYATVIHQALQRVGPAPVYSIGCGAGAEEIEVLRAADRLGFAPFAIFGLELSPISVERAEAAAAAAGYADRFLPRVHDLNAGLPALAPAAAIMAHHVLHHIVELELLYAHLAAGLHPQGSFVTYDMMGRNGHMRWPEVLPAVRALWQHLPERYRHDHVWHRPMPHFQDWDCAIEGFEGVRAQEVLPLLAEHFVPARLVTRGAVMEVFTSDRVGPGFDPFTREDDRAFLGAVAEWERGLLARRETTPTEFVGEFRRRDSGFAPPAEIAEAMRLALRPPVEVFPVVPVPELALPWPVQPGAAPLPLPVGEMAASEVQASGALQDGWLLLDDGAVWAIVEEQGLDLRFAGPVAALRFEFWHNQPPEREQAITVLLDGQPVARTGVMPSGELSFLDLRHPEGGSSSWSLRLRCATWRRPDQDGGEDRRPLSYSLFRLHATPMQQAAQPGAAQTEAARPLWRRALRRLLNLS